MIVDQDLMLCDEHIGKKVYEIEEEVSYIVKTQVIAKDDDEAFNKYLECSETRDCDGYSGKHNGYDIVSTAKEYSQHKGTKLVGTVQREDEQDQDSLLEVA
jgi:phosphatidate phosphatase PAH1|tara:strand:+ start:205 stop:507 length:303 start_codon:yes stop_codon:yes gene_type:complete